MPSSQLPSRFTKTEQNQNTSPLDCKNNAYCRYLTHELIAEAAVKLPTPLKQVNIHIHRAGVVCPACEFLELAAMQDSFAELPFTEALPLWLYNHTPSIHPNTLHYYKQYGNALLPFFGPMKLKDIGFGQVRGFQRWRSHLYTDNDTLELPLEGELLTSKFRHAAGNVRIRNEINCVLKPILREAGVWDEIVKKKFKHLPVPREGAGIALSIEQWEEIFSIGFEKECWMLGTHCVRIMFKGGYQFGELKRVRRKDVDLAKGTVSIIVGAKNATARPRTLALVSSALESMKWIIARYERLGGTSPNDFILPHRKGLKQGHVQFDKPMTSIYRTVKAIAIEWAARCPKTAQPDVRPRDARVSTASLLLSNSKLSLATIERALGWTPSTAMRKRYFRAETEMLREALNTLEGINAEN